MTDAEMIEALERKIVQLVSEIEAAEARLQELKAQLDRARLALGAFDPERAPARPAKAPKGKRWAPNRPAPRMDRLFADCEIMRRTCDAIRQATEPLSVAAIAQQIVLGQGAVGVSAGAHGARPGRG